jgi:CRP-like cAMP-binding protein
VLPPDPRLAGWRESLSRENELFGPAVENHGESVVGEVAALRLIDPHLTSVPLAAGTIVYEVGDEIDRVYFPSSGIASLQMVMNNGRAIDTAIVGRDGALGAMAAHAPCRAAARCLVRAAMTAFAISALEYRRAAAGEVALQMLVMHYQDTLLSQTQANAARYACLPINRRLAACLLDVSNLLASESVPLTQNTLAEMLAARRSSVSEVGSRLKAEGIIDYSRGEITILDHTRLLKWSEPSKREAAN